MGDKLGIYDPEGYRKHKRPEGWGSLCPDDLPEQLQELLRSGVLVGDAVFNVSGNYALRAMEHLPGRWHGHPIPWSRLPQEAVQALKEAGRLTDEFYRKALRKNLGQEFNR